MSAGWEGCGGGGGGGRGGGLDSIHQLEFYRRKKDWRLDRESASPENLPDKTKLGPTKLQPSKLRQPKIWSISSSSRTQKPSKIAAVFPKIPPRSSEMSAGCSKLTEKTCETNTGDSKLIEIHSGENTGGSKFFETNSDGSKLIDTTCETNTAGFKFCEANSEKTCETNMKGSKIYIEDENVSCFDQTYSVEERCRSTQLPGDSETQEAESIATPARCPREGAEVWTEHASSPTLLDMDVVSASFLHQQHSLEELSDEEAFARGARLRAHSSQVDLACGAPPPCRPTYSEVASKAKKSNRTLKEALVPPPAHQRDLHHLPAFSSTGSTKASTTANKVAVTNTTEQNTQKHSNNSRSALNDNVRGNRDDNHLILEGNRDDSCAILRGNHNDSSARDKRHRSLSLRGNRDNNYLNLRGNHNDSCGIPSGNHHDSSARDKRDGSFRGNRHDNYHQPKNEIIYSPNSNPTDIMSGQWGDLVEDISRLESENDRRFATNNTNYATRVWRNRQQDMTFNNNIKNAWSSDYENVDSNHNNNYVGGNRDNNVYVGSTRDDNVYVESNHDDNVNVAGNRDDNIAFEHNYSDRNERDYTFYGYPSLAQHRNDQIDFMDTYNKHLESVRVDDDRINTEFMELDSDVASPNWKYGEEQQNYRFVEPNDASGLYEPRQWGPRNNKVNKRFELQNSNGRNGKTYPQKKIIQREIYTTTIDYENSKVYVDECTSIVDPSVLSNGGSFNCYGSCYDINRYDGNQYDGTPFGSNIYEGHHIESNPREGDRYKSNQYEGNHFVSNRCDHYGMHGQNSFMFSPQGLNAFVSVQRPVFRGNRTTVPTSLNMPWPGRGRPP